MVKRSPYGGGGILGLHISRIPLSFRYHVNELKNPGQIYSDCMDLIDRLASFGFVHCDFNEFNLLITNEGKVIVIDFPQMVSIDHVNAPM